MTVALPYTLRNSSKTRGFTDVVDADGETVAYLVPVADARFIVEACNAHERLCDRLDRLDARTEAGV